VIVIAVFERMEKRNEVMMKVQKLEVVDAKSLLSQQFERGAPILGRKE